LPLSRCSFQSAKRPRLFVPPQETEQARWFAEEVQPHEAALRAYLHGLFPTLRDIDDLVQDTYSRLIRAHAIGQVRHAKAYLFATARNAAVDFFRHERVSSIDDLVKIEELSVLEDTPDAAEKACHDQELKILKEAIAALPPCCREILEMRKLQGLSYQEIARKLDISERTVNAQLAIGLLRCRKHLKACGVLRGATHAID